MSTAQKQTVIGSERDPRSQPIRALEYANQVRLARVELRRGVNRGDISVVEVLADPPSEAETMPIGQLLMAQTRWGRRRTTRLLSRTGVTGLKPIGEMTQRQRSLVARELEGRDLSEVAVA